MLVVVLVRRIARLTRCLGRKVLPSCSVLNLLFIGLGLAWPLAFSPGRRPGLLLLEDLQVFFVCGYFPFELLDFVSAFYELLSLRILEDSDPRPQLVGAHQAADAADQVDDARTSVVYEAQLG